MELATPLLPTRALTQPQQRLQPEIVRLLQSPAGSLDGLSFISAWEEEDFGSDIKLNY